MKGEHFYKPLPVEYFGKLPSLNFIRDTTVSPGSPKGRPRYSSEESVRGEGDNRREGKRKERSMSVSPHLTKNKLHKPSIHDVSDDFPNLEVNDPLSSLSNI